MKAQASGHIFYNIKNDSYEFFIKVPCGDHDRKLFRSSEQELEYYKHKISALSVFALSSNVEEGAFKMSIESKIEGNNGKEES